MSDITIKIDGKSVSCGQGEILLNVLKRNGFDVPALCYHSDLCIKANCRLCLVEVIGKAGVQTSCSVKVQEGMEIITQSPQLFHLRKKNVELLFGQHKMECHDCVIKNNCALLEYRKKYRVKPAKFSNRKLNYPSYAFGPSINFDSSKCIDCHNCVEVCEQQQCRFFEIKKNSDFFEVTPSSSEKKDCIYCGQCVAHCPVGAIEAVGEFEDSEKFLKLGNKIVLVQFAPALRATIGESFGLPHGSLVTEQLISAIKKLGLKNVFDVSAGADITTVEEVNELIERIEKKGVLPMFSSCCPAWVKWVEFYEPEWIPNFTTARSPHIMLGGVLKFDWAKKKGVNPKDVFVVSVMPCTAKKYEITRPELEIDGLKPVDMVITTRELAWIFKKHKIDLKKVSTESSYSQLCRPTGAGVIYGKSGGVTESAFRTAFEKLAGRPLDAFYFENHPTIPHAKVARVKIDKIELKALAVNTMASAKMVLQEIKDKNGQYHYIEFMACPDGCIGGGGQPLPVDQEIRDLRIKALKQADEKCPIRAAHHNPDVIELQQGIFKDEAVRKKILHTRYSPKKREVKL